LGKSDEILVDHFTAINNSIPALSPKPSPAKSPSTETPPQLLLFSFIWNLRRLNIIVSIGFLVRSLIVYVTLLWINSAKELWTALEEEYGLDDAGIERFTSSSFNKFMMFDNKPIDDQLHEFQDFIRHLQLKGNQFSDDYKVSCLIDKLPSSWSTFAGHLHRKQGDLTLVQALKAICIKD